jgi:8-oxo-dGTP diphosphatase
VAVTKRRGSRDSETKGLDDYDVSKFDRPSVAVDLVIFTVRDRDLQVLLIRRGEAPYEGRWALPGGFVRIRESLEAAARRELEEETGVRDVYLEQLYTFGNPDRDPRTRVVTVAYFALISSDSLSLRATADAREVRWHSAFHHPKLAFDHEEILTYAIERLRSKIEYTTIGFQLLPDKFTLAELQRAYEIILSRPLDKRNFRKKMLSLGVLVETGESKMEGIHRPAQLFRFADRRLMNAKDRGTLVPH